MLLPDREGCPTPSFCSTNSARIFEWVLTESTYAFNNLLQIRSESYVTKICFNVVYPAHCGSSYWTFFWCLMLVLPAFCYGKNIFRVTWIKDVSSLTSQFFFFVFVIVYVWLTYVILIILATNIFVVVSNWWTITGKNTVSVSYCKVGKFFLLLSLPFFTILLSRFYAQSAVAIRFTLCSSVFVLKTFSEKLL